MSLWSLWLTLLWFLRQHECSVKLYGTALIEQDSKGLIIQTGKILSVNKIALKTYPSGNCSDLKSLDIRIGGQFPDADIDNWMDRNNKFSDQCDSSWIPGFTADFSCDGNPRIGKVITFTSVPNNTDIVDILIFATEVKEQIREYMKPPEIIKIPPENTMQSATKVSSKPASNAVNANKALYSKSTSIQPWWAADLGNVYSVTSVMITPRLTSDAVKCARFSDIEIKVGNTAPVQQSSQWILKNDRCFFAYVTARNCKLGVPHEYVCNQPPPRGRYISIQLLSILDVVESLELTFVKVYGVKEDDTSTAQALKLILDASKTSQSSTNGKFIPSNAIDVGSAFTHTSTEDLPWWAVNLGGTYMVTSVDVTPRQRPEVWSLQCENFRDIEVRVGDHSPDMTDKKWTQTNALCALLRGAQERCSSGSWNVLFTCSQFRPPMGSYVSIQSVVGTSLQLRNVQVYGFPVNVLASPTLMEDNRLEIQTFLPDGGLCESLLINETFIKSVSPLSLPSFNSCAAQCQQTLDCCLFKWDEVSNSSCYIISKSHILPSLSDLLSSKNASATIEKFNYYGCHGTRAYIYTVH